MGDDLAAGSTFAKRYRLLELVGEGANARVFLADDLTLRRRVAVKILNEGLAQNPAFMERFEQEMRAAAALNLPRLVHLHDWGLDPCPYMVNEFIDGGSLAAILSGGRVLSPSQALFVGLEAARGLVNLHARGHAHLGIRTSSILFDSDNRVFVSDLGLAPALAAAADTAPADVTGEPGAESVGDAGSPVIGEPGAESIGDTDGEVASTPGGRDDRAGRADDDRSEADGAALEESESSQEAVRAVAYSKEQQAQDVRALALVINEAATGLRWSTDDLAAEPFAPSLALGPMQDVLQRAVDQPPDDGLDAAGLTEELLRVAGLLPRPDPLPLVLQGDLPANAAASRGVAGARGVGGDRAGAGAAGKRGAASAGGVAANRGVAGARGVGGDRAGARGVSGAVDTGLAPAPQMSPAALLDDVPRRRWPRVVLAALVVLGGASAAVWAWMENRPEIATVPDLSGDTREAAIAAAARFDWQVEEVLVRQPDTEPGEVVYTEPAVGVELSDGEALIVFVSLGEPLVPVVKLDRLIFGATVAQAEKRLAEAGFEASGETLANHYVLAAGSVIGIDAGDAVFEIEPGAKVRLLVSDGPAEQP